MNKTIFASIAFVAVVAVLGLFLPLGGQTVVERLKGVSNTSSVVGLLATRNENVASTTASVTNIKFRDTIVGGENVAFWRNDTGSTVYITRQSVAVVGTSSARMSVTAATSTESIPNSTASSTFEFYSRNPEGAPRLSNDGVFTFIVATSSTLTTLAANGLTPLVATSTFRLRDGEYLNLVLAGERNCSGSELCPTATSTEAKRGFILDWVVEGYATSTPKYDRR